MKIALVIVSDRGDKYLPMCIEAIDKYLPGDLVEIFVDDSEHRLGMAGAVRQGFHRALEAGADYAWWMEEDFLLTEPVALDRMVDILEDNPRLAQLVLKRQPWSPEEKAAGGFIERRPEKYFQREGFVEHQQIFSLNPCLIPRHILHMGYPDGNEAAMTELLVGKGFTFGIYGQLDDPPRCLHIGVERAAGWKL